MSAALPPLLAEQLADQVRATLLEDIGSGDLTAALIPATRFAQAQIITRQAGVFCGGPWVTEVFYQLDPEVRVQLLVEEGQRLQPHQPLFTVQGAARSLLTGERSALNFVQLLSGIATRCQGFADQVAHTQVKLLDTRKTLPGLRLAQKYAVTCGGCFNHRMGLYDAYLIKENHIAAAGSITQAVMTARHLAPHKPIEVEVENLTELTEALAAAADIIMLDEFDLEQTRTAVKLNAGRAKLEASGGIDQHQLVAVAETGVDYISLGTLTKDIQSLDLSMRFIN